MKLPMLVVSILVCMALPAWSEEAPPRRGPGDAPPMRPFMNPLVQAVDSNGDGTLGAEEIQNAAAALKKLDSNGDGAIQPEEMRPAMRGGGRQGPPEGGGFRGGGFPGGEAGPRRGEAGGPPGGSDGAAFQAAPLAKDDAEKKILDVLADMDANQRRGNMNVPVVDGRLLRLLTEAMGAKLVVEIGMSTGYSGIWQCLALKKTGGKLMTFEIDERRASVARENFARAGVADIITIVMGDAHEKVKDIEGPIDMVFLDADKEGYLDYLEQLIPKVRPGGLIVAHNINPRMADSRYIKAITENPALETLFPSLEGTGGVSVSMKKR